MQWATVRTDTGPVRALVVRGVRSDPLFLPGLAEGVVVESLATAAMLTLLGTGVLLAARRRRPA